MADINNNSKQLPQERIEILINPETLEYSVSYEDTIVGHLYVVLREIISSCENGDLCDTFQVEDGNNGKPATRTEFRENIEDIKKEYENAKKEDVPINFERDYRD